jgi:endonuclease/exonuclease/phosphatase family metal-dependent hydrolase
LSVAHEINIDAQRFVHGSNGITSTLRTLLRSTGRSILRTALFKPLHPLAHQAKSVTEPAGLLVIRPAPHQITANTPNSSLTIISSNLYHGWPRQDNLLARLSSFAQLVEEQQADIILLQEVSRTPAFKADEWLSERLGFAYVYSRANGHQDIGFEEGVAVFSRFPLRSPRLKEFSNRLNPFVRRIALGVYSDTPFGIIPLFSVHLGIMPQENAAQIVDLRDWVSGITGKYPAFIAGDFNTHESTPQIRYAQAKWTDTYRCLHPDQDGTTHQLNWPWGAVMRRARLDYIFYKPGNTNWQVTTAQHLETPNQSHSDHRVVLTRLKFAQ